MIDFLDKHPIILAILVCGVLLGLLGYHLFFEKYLPKRNVDFAKEWQDQEWFDAYFNYICKSNEEKYPHLKRRWMSCGENSDQI